MPSSKKQRKGFFLSDEVVRALAQHVATQIQEGSRKTPYGAESEIVEEALRMVLGMPMKEDDEGE